MSDSRSPSDPAGRPGWRSKSKAGASGAYAAKKGGWTKNPDVDIQRAAMRYRTKVVLWSGLFLMLVAGLVWWLIRTPLVTPFIVASGVNYSYPLPPNAFAWEDAEKFRVLGNSSKPVLKVDSVPVVDAKNWLEQLAAKVRETKPLGPGKNVIVVYLSMHGAVDGKGRACVIPPGLDSKDMLVDTNWVRVEDLLCKIFPDAEYKYRDKKFHKLVIFDCNRMDMNWGIGLLYNTFAADLAGVVERLHEKRIPGLVVLNSVSPGEVAWTMPSRGQSAFGYYLFQGLGGAARAKEHGNTITLKDLAGYVRDKVSDWAVSKRDDRQSPALMPKDAEDFPLVFAHPDVLEDIRAKEKESARTKASTDDRWEEIGGFWTDFSRIRNELAAKNCRIDPEKLAIVQHLLLNMEQLVQAGAAAHYRDEYAKQKKSVEDCMAFLKGEPRTEQLAAYSLPLNRCFGRLQEVLESKGPVPPWMEPEAKKDEAKAADPGPKPGEAPSGAEKTPDAKKDKNTAKPGESVKSEEKPSPPPEPAQPRKIEYPTAVSAAWDWVKKEPRSSKEVAKCLDFIGKSEAQPPAHFVEAQFLRMTASYLDPWIANDIQGRRWTASAFLTRDLAESAAAPADERAYYWIRRDVENGDSSRRAAEDLLFVGSRSSLAEIAKPSEAAMKEYRKAESDAKIVSDAYSARDRAYRELPYFARWTLSRAFRSDRAKSEAALADAIQAARRLDDALAKRTETQAIAAIGLQLSDSIKRLDADYREQYDEIRNASSKHQAQIAGLIDILAVPLLDGRERSLALRRFSERLTENAEDAEDANKPVSESGGTNRSERKTVSDEYLASAQPWIEARHPLLRMLENTGEKKSADAMKMELPAQGATVRAMLREFLLSDATVKPAVDLLTAEEIRRPLDAAERNAAIFAPIVGAGSASRRDGNATAFARLLNFDHRQILLWHARRAMEDFWGPSKKPYFESVASRYLKSAVNLFREGDMAEEKATASLLADRRKAAMLGMKIAAADLESLDPDQTRFEQQVKVAAPKDFPPGVAAVFMQTSDQMFAGANGELSSADELYPVAEKADAKTAEVRRMGYSISATDHPADLGFWLLKGERMPSELNAVAYYRGFLGHRAFSVNPDMGWDVKWTKPNFPESTITVRGDLAKKINLMFILDCSGSMDVKDISNDLSRFDAARNALREILERITADTPAYNVGLIAYGSRTYWKRSDHGYVKTTSEQNLPKDVYPFNDVKEIEPLEPLNPAKRDKLIEKMRTLEPTGETPLYYSLVYAKNRLEKMGIDDPVRIILITDGGDNQFYPDPANVDAEMQQDVMIARENKTTFDKAQASMNSAKFQISLDILGVDFQLGVEDYLDRLWDNLSEEEKRRKGPPETFKNSRMATARIETRCATELKEWAVAKKCFYDVSNKSDMVQAIEKSLNLLTYRVQEIETRKFVTKESLAMNAPCVIHREDKIKVGYRVLLETPEDRSTANVNTDKLVKADVVLEGGEALVLTVKGSPKSGGLRLVHEEYGSFPPDDTIPDATVTGLPDLGKVLFRTHNPESVSEVESARNGVKFFLSVQNSDRELFSPRPIEIWAEIAPLTGDAATARAKDRAVSRVGASASPYVFYDSVFKPDTPVPVLEFFVPDWPHGIEYAEIRFWCKFGDNPKHIALSDTAASFVKSPKSLSDATFETKILKIAKANFEGTQVVVTESHASDFNAESLVKVSMEDPDGKLVAINRHFNDQTKKIVHKFTFVADKEKVENYKIILTDSKNCKLDSYAAPDGRPLTVKVPSSEAYSN